jgi:L-threonylcarbamoyladenylate synthase
MRPPCRRDERSTRLFSSSAPADRCVCDGMSATPDCQPRVLDARHTPNQEVAAEAADVLGRGGLVILPTDTVYGVAALPGRADAVERIYRAKRREQRKPIPLLASSMDAVAIFGATLGKHERRLAQRFWPGPLTLILQVNSGYEGFRVPDHITALAILRAAGGVLRVSSANLSGEPPALTAEQAMTALGPSVELIVDAGRVAGKGEPSAVVKMEQGNLRVLREGPISRQAMERAAGLRTIHPGTKS